MIRRSKKMGMVVGVSTLTETQVLLLLHYSLPHRTLEENPLPENLLYLDFLG